MGEASRALTIALAEPADVQQTAYLFDMQPEVEGVGLTLAVPHQPTTRERPAWLCGISSALELPSNVQSVRLEYDAPLRADYLPDAVPMEPSPEPRRMPGAIPLPEAEAKAESAPMVQSTPRMTPRVGGRREERSVRHYYQPLPAVDCCCLPSLTITCCYLPPPSVTCRHCGELPLHAIAKVRLVVEKRVPFVGWLLLAAALLASQSAGAVVNVQAFTSSTENIFLRNMWRGMCTSTVMAASAATHPSGRYGLRTLVLEGSGSQWLMLAIAGAALFLEKAGLVTAS